MSQRRALRHPSWCAGAVFNLPCGIQHLGFPAELPATAALTPAMLTVYPVASSNIPEVTLVVGGRDVDLTPAEARRLAAALLFAAEQAESK